MQEQLNRIDKRLAKLEKMLTEALAKVPPAQKKRMTEIEVMEEYGVSKIMLARLRMGYKRSDGVEIAPRLFKWGHRNGRDFDYDRDEVDIVLKRTQI